MRDEKKQIVDHVYVVDQAVTNHPTVEEATDEIRGGAASDRDILEKTRESMEVENNDHVIDGAIVPQVAVGIIVRERAQLEIQDEQVEEKVGKDRKIVLVEAHLVERVESIPGLIILIERVDQNLCQTLLAILSPLPLIKIRKQRRKSRNKH